MTEARQSQVALLAGLPLLNQLNEVGVEGDADGSQLDQVQAALAGLVLADEGLRALQPLSEVDLAQP